MASSMIREKAGSGEAEGESAPEEISGVEIKLAAGWISLIFENLQSESNHIPFIYRSNQTDT